MAKRSEEWKKYLKEVKTRINENKLKLNEQEENEIFYLNNKKLSSQEIERINDKICEVAASKNFIPNPLGLLTDKEVYENLTDQKKMKYILDLSTIYLTLKAKNRK